MSETTKTIQTTRDSNGMLRLDDLSLIQRDALYKELGKLDETDFHFVQSGIERILDNFVAQRAFVEARGSHNEELKKAIRVSNALRELEESLDSLGPEAILDMLDVSDSEEEHDFKGFMRAVSFWSSETSDFVKWYKVPRGRRTLEEFDEAIIDLIALYEHTTGKRATLPSQYVAAPASNAQDVHGPFARFCVDVLDIVFSTEQSTVLNSIRKILNRRKKSASDS